MAHRAERAAYSGDTHAIQEAQVGLYEEARRRLLQNEPLLGEASGRGAMGGGGATGKLTVGEAAALESVGLSTAPFASEGAEDPLQRSIADYMALLETSYTTSEAAKYLKVDVSRIRQRLRERTLVGIDYDGERRLPRFQFERHQVLPGLREVIAALPEGLNPLDVAQWFLAANPDLEAGERTLSPRNWLLQGRPVEAVVELARGFE
jgi:hypothetical protein